MMLPVLLLLFIGSGCAALIYEIVWFQMLSLIVGSSAISLGVLLGTFMGGMCIGSLLLPKYVKATEHPLRIYAMLESGIAICGIAILFGLPSVGGFYAAVGSGGFGGLLINGLFCAIFLLLPTVLMGATLPAVARWVESTPRGVSWLGFFYGGNIAGAVFGCLLAGFYLLREHDVTYATFVAVTINIAVALIGLILSRTTAYTAPAAGSSTSTAGTGAPAGAKWIYIAIGLSGATALGAEVLWTRLLSLLLGATVYTFSLILAAILVGLGIGSSLGAFIGRSSPNPRRALACCQIGLMLAIAWGANLAVHQLPYWPVNPLLAATPSSLFEVDFFRCLAVVLPAAILWGASFPLALAASGNRCDRSCETRRASLRRQHRGRDHRRRIHQPRPPPLGGNPMGPACADHRGRRGGALRPHAGHRRCRRALAIQPAHCLRTGAGCACGRHGELAGASAAGAARRIWQALGRLAGPHRRIHLRR